ncbi:MAG: hypothetical protein QOH25_34 [Acidobacteriota bacterium]|jgi:hypothetical protein|nr:hypothetical protein [Acidobacteriota bacterium]
MVKARIQSFDAYKNRARRLEKRWQELCARYLPLSAEDSIWRYHRVRDSSEPEQGWKLHLSATVLNAGKILERVGPFLAARRVQFKAPRSLRELIRINSGLVYGYSQVGKIITVYPRTPGEAVSLAKMLHKMTRRVAAPVVPFDLRFSAASNVYYRFGAFNPLEMEDANGRSQPAIRNPLGELTPDLRESANARPDWVSNPFEEERPERRQHRHTCSPQTKNFRVFRALVQRGKGGVYQAVDLSVSPPRLCLLKEGRKNGELNCDGRDGSWRVRNEEHVLARLAGSGVDVPGIYTSFEVDGNYYLVTEFIEGECLHHLLRKLKKRMPVSCVLRYGIQLAGIFSQIHLAGWVWRDCKPLNLIVTPRGELRPLDFEGACPVDEPDPMLWGTPGFTPPEWRDLNLQTGRHDDLYALGSMLYLLLTGRVPDQTAPIPIEKLRPRVPSTVCELAMKLLSRHLEQRPSAATVARALKKVLSFLEDKGTPQRRKRQDAMAKSHNASARNRAHRRLEPAVTASAVMGV